MYGPPGEIRTPDTQVRSLVLYPAELRAGAKLRFTVIKGQEIGGAVTQQRANPASLDEARQNAGRACSQRVSAGPFYRRSHSPYLNPVASPARAWDLCHR